jgi:hypothetical protein
MEIFQKDILGGGIAINSEKLKKSSEKTAIASKKEYKPITISDGIDEKRAEADAMLIHRFLQKRARNKSLLLKLLKNEMNIKNGKVEAVTAVRDSLLSVFLMK